MATLNAHKEAANFISSGANPYSVVAFEPSDIPKIVDNFLLESESVLQDNIVEKYLFGSYATKTHTPLSDIDILIVVKSLTPDMQSRVSGLASEYALRHDVCFSPILTDTGAWEKNKKFNTLFYQEIVRNGIKL